MNPHEALSKAETWAMQADKQGNYLRDTALDPERSMDDAERDATIRGLQVSATLANMWTRLAQALRT